MIELGVNIDHVATVRQARRTVEPDPVWAAVEAQLGGADLITMHLREDRRHVQDHDVERAKAICHIRLNLEMAATEEMIRIASRIKPQMATLVPEGRLEITTEGGLDVAGQVAHSKEAVAKLTDAGILASAFIDADPKQIDAVAEAGFTACEIHTGPYANLLCLAGGRLHDPTVAQELAKVSEAGKRVRAAAMRFNAGHALTYLNVGPIAALPGLSELHIGHSIVSRALFVGLRRAVTQMKQLMLQHAEGSTPEPSI